MSETELLAFPTFGNVSLVHITDIHAQLKPVFFREPSINLGVGEVKGKPPHLTGEGFPAAVRHQAEHAAGLRAEFRGLCRDGQRPMAGWAASTGLRP